MPTRLHVLGDPAPRKTTELRVGRIAFPVIKIGDGRYMTWWKDGSVRRQLTSKSLDKLRNKLQTVSSNILSGQIDANQLDTSDHRAYIAARQALVSWHISVDLACREYAATREKLGPEVSLDAAADFYNRFSTAAGAVIAAKTFPDVVDEFLTAKRAKGLSSAYLTVMNSDLMRAARYFAERKIADLTPHDLEMYFGTLGRRRRVREKIEFVPAGPRRRQQVQDTFVTLFNWAKGKKQNDKKYLPNLPTAADACETIKVIDGGNPIYDPAQLLAYFEATLLYAREWLPWIAIGAFTGMRTGAILRLDWSAFNWEQGTIEVEARQSKISRRYLATLHPALVAWLADWREATGAVAPGNKDALSVFTAKLGRWASKLSKRDAMKWRQNALRSSFIGYRFAQTGNENLVAKECNTSAKEVLTEYKNIRTITGKMVTAELAEQWFNVHPDQAKNLRALRPSPPAEQLDLFPEENPDNVVQGQFQF